MFTKHGYCVYVTDGDTGEKLFLRWYFSRCLEYFEYGWVSEFDYSCVFAGIRHAKSALKCAGGKEQAVIAEGRYTRGALKPTCFKPLEDER